MTDTRVTQHHREKLQPAEAFNLQGSHDPQKPGLPQEPGFLFGSCCSGRFTRMGADGRPSEASRTRCHLGCARAQALACLVCMCAPARSADGAGMQRFSRARLVWVACGHSRDDIASLAQTPCTALPTRSLQPAAGRRPGAQRQHSRTGYQTQKPVVELTLRQAQTGRNDWAASEPVTDNHSEHVASAQLEQSQTSPRGGNGRRNGLRSRGRKPCPFDPGRGDQHSQENTMKKKQSDPSFRGHEQAPQRLPV